jgi:acyl-CoA thioesterase
VAEGAAPGRPSEFDTDTAVGASGAVGATGIGRFEATVTPRWSIGAFPNGGYLLAIGARAMAVALAPHVDPFSVTGHYLSPPVEGPITVDVEPVRRGRTLSTATASLRQDGRERLRMLATYGDLATVGGPETVTAAPLDLPAPVDCFRGRTTFAGGVSVSIAERFEMLIHPDDMGWAHGKPSGEARVRAWVRFADGREPDPLALLLIVDALPPAVFNLGVSGWVPTLEMTVHIRATPAPGWLRVAAHTRNLAGGYLEEDAEVWDSADRLVAQSRQLARRTDG